MSPLLFDLISFIYAINSVRVFIALVRSWRSFWDDKLTPQDRQLAQRVGFFLIIPFGVLLHEYGHAVATRMVGGEVVEFQWRLFWGYVRTAGSFTPAQDWWISLSGNVVSVLFGLVLVASGYWGRKLRRPLRYVLLDAGRFQVLYSLIGYPLLSFAGFIGDWVTIYDFDRTPLLSGVALAVHLLVLGGFWAWWRSAPVQETIFALAHNLDDVLPAYLQAVRERPEDVSAWLRLADLYASEGAIELAERTIRKALSVCGEQGVLYEALGQYALMRGRPQAAVAALEKALQLDLDAGTYARALVNLGIAYANMGRAREALETFERMRTAVDHSPIARYWRGLAHRNLGNDAAARADWEAVLAMLNPEDPLARQVQQDLQTLSESTL